MARILWTKQAATDLASIPDVSRATIVDKVDLLADFPSMGPAMDGAYAGFRQLLVDRYRMMYQMVPDEVRIAYVRHGARQLGLRVVRGGREPGRRGGR